MFGLEESTHYHFLDLRDGGQLAEGHHAQETASTGAPLTKLEEAGTVDWLEGEGGREGSNLVSVMFRHNSINVNVPLMSTAIVSAH